MDQSPNELMESQLIAEQIQAVLDQRVAFFGELGAVTTERLWRRPDPKSWSIGEHLSHLEKMMRVYRFVANVWVPLARPFAGRFVKRPYQRSFRDVFGDYERRHGRPMPVPFMVLPSRRPDAPLEDLKERLDRGLARLVYSLRLLPDVLAGHIRIPDPMADYGNIIQFVGLLGVHERYHFEMVRSRSAGG